MTSKPREKKTHIAIHTLSKISKSKRNQKFGQLIEYNTRNIFIEKSYKCGGEAIPRPFSKIKI